MDFALQRKKLVKNLEDLGYIRTKKVRDAMLKVPRELFVPEDQKSLSYIDEPLRIPGNVTISAPHMHALSLEALKLKKGDKFLEVGAGSGILLAYAYEIIREENKVFGIEIIKETFEFAKRNLKKSGYWDKVKLVYGDGSLGLPEEAPFDKILISAAAPDFPRPLIRQLKVDGLIAGMIGGLYTGQFLVRGKKLRNGRLKREELLPVIFVPLKGKYGWKI
jgi:protein-L-isoaspartate(D-aspartate) O-methyltransferase